MLNVIMLSVKMPTLQLITIFSIMALDAECCSAEWHLTQSVASKLYMLSVVMLNVTAPKCLSLSFTTTLV
jgi:hypothetical protein